MSTLGSLRQLMEQPHPLLFVWLYDSDVWGYVLLRGGATIAEFVNDPAYFGGGMEPFLEGPPHGDVRSGAPAELCRVLDLPGREATIARLQSKRALFKETALHAFCDALGLAPAATSYRYLEHAEVDTDWTGWRVECLRYASGDDEPYGSVDVHSDSAFVSPDAHAARMSSNEAVPFEIPFRMRAMLAFVKVVFVPLGFLFRAVMWVWLLRQRLGGKPPLPTHPLVRLPGHPPAPRIDGEYLVNDLHRCRVRLPPGAEAGDRPGLWSPAGVWGVFTAGLGPGFVVCCEARPLDALRQIDGHGTLLEDECYAVGELKVRRRLFEAPAHGTAAAVRSEVYVLQGPRALYVWRLMDAADADPFPRRR